MERFVVQPGQFMIVRFLQKKLWWQAHPFSLSFVPDDQRIRITAKQLGDFTQQMENVSLGTKVIIDGPYGVFTDFFGVTSKALFIAGGIGITPIRSLFEQMLQKSKKVAMIYANRTEKDIIFKKELDDLALRYNAPVYHVLSEERNYSGEAGHVNLEKISRLVPDFKSRDIYLCGPVKMMTELIVGLKQSGFPMKQLHYEKFSL